MVAEFMIQAADSVGFCMGKGSTGPGNNGMDT